METFHSRLYTDLKCHRLLNSLRDRAAESYRAIMHLDVAREVLRVPG
jgi:hypothetical protein